MKDGKKERKLSPAGWRRGEGLRACSFAIKSNTTVHLLEEWPHDAANGH